MTTRVLITGGAGYLGSVLTGHLLQRGYQVTVLDNLLYGRASLLSYCREERFEFVLGDARDERVLRELLPKHDALIPLAAIVGMKACDHDPLMARSVNLDAIVLLNRLRDPGQPVIMPCTNSGYGTKSGDLFCTEETPMEPISLYGVTKVAAERALLDSQNAISLRLATVFGPSPRMRLDLLVNDFTYRAITDGFLVIYEKDFKRNYVHIDDVAECFSYCLEHFDAMKKYINFLETKIDKNTGILNEGPLGDWLSPEGNKNDNTLFWMSYFAYDLDIVSQMATALGKNEEAQALKKRSEEIKK